MRLNQPLVFLTYYPPLVGTQRVGRFVDELRRRGLDARVVCSDHEWTGPVPDHVRLVVDPLFSRAARRSSLEHAQLAGRNEQGVSRSALQSLKLLVKSGISIPDMHLWWAWRAGRETLRWLAGQPFTLVTSGPPFSVIPVGAWLKRRTGCSWICDYRDGWTFDSLDPILLRFAFRRWLDRRLEIGWAKQCDAILSATQGIADDLRLRGVSADRIHLVYNAFEPVRMAPKPVGSQRRRIVHTGRLALSRPGTTALPFWKALGLAQRRLGRPLEHLLQVDLYGDYTLEEQREPASAGVGDAVRFLGRVDAREAMQAQAEADLLLLALRPNSPHVLTGKVFEYLATGRPILAVGDTDGELAQILSQTGAGEVFSHQDIRLMADRIGDWLATGQPACQAVRSVKEIEKHSIARRTDQLLEILGLTQAPVRLPVAA